MSDFNEKLKNFAIDLYKIDAIKFGEFKMKVGLMSPIYCDLRVIVSYPKILDNLAQLLIEHIKSIKEYNLICGVPYTALPIATAMSVKTDISMVMRRKEAKDYGTRKMIEGKFEEGNTCLIVEDVVTSGSSILETVKDLNNAGLKATSAIVVLNREQGGEKILRENGVTMHSLLTISKLMNFLLEAKCVDQSIVDKVKNYLQQTQIDNKMINTPKYNRLRMSFTERAKHSNNSVGKKLFQIMSDKKSNLCIAADLTSSVKLLQLAEQIGPQICILKTHIDIIEDYSQDFIEKLNKIAKAHNFLIMEDRKFADIGKTVQLQFSKGMYHISSWADLITAHSLPGKGLIQALNESEGKERGIFLLAEMSSAGNLCNESYSVSSIKLAQEYSDSVTGIVCQSPKFTEIPNLIQLTPGIQLDKAGDNLGQQYNSPELAVLDRGADIGVVGRGITMAENPVSAVYIILVEMNHSKIYILIGLVMLLFCKFDKFYTGINFNKPRNDLILPLYPNGFREIPQMSKMALQ